MIAPVTAGLGPYVGTCSKRLTAQIMHGKTDYIEFYGELEELSLAISHDPNIVRYMPERNAGPHSIIEFGSSSTRECGEGDFPNRYL
jgi:hypothetical protein